MRSEAVIDKKKSRPPRRHRVSMRFLGSSAGMYRRLIASKTVVQYSVYYSARGSHLHVACGSVCDRDQVFDRQKYEKCT